MERDNNYTKQLNKLRTDLGQLVPENHPQLVLQKPDLFCGPTQVKVTRCSGGMFTIALRSVEDGKATSYPSTYFIVAKEQVTKVNYPEKWLTQEVKWKGADSADLQTLLDFLDFLPTKVE